MNVTPIAGSLWLVWQDDAGWHAERDDVTHHAHSLAALRRLITHGRLALS